MEQQNSVILYLIASKTKYFDGMDLPNPELVKQKMHKMLEINFKIAYYASKSYTKSYNKSKIAEIVKNTLLNVIP